MILKAIKFLNKFGLMSLYYSFNHLYLAYCNHIWGATYKTRLKRLVILQNKAIRVLAHSENRASSDPFIWNWILWNLKISTLISLAVLCFVCPLIKFHSPLGVCSSFTSAPNWNIRKFSNSFSWWKNNVKNYRHMVLLFKHVEVQKIYLLNFCVWH